MSKQPALTVIGERVIERSPMDKYNEIWHNMPSIIAQKTAPFFALPRVRGNDTTLSTEVFMEAMASILLGSP